LPKKSVLTTNRVYKYFHVNNLKQFGEYSYTCSDQKMVNFQFPKYSEEDFNGDKVKFVKVLWFADWSDKIYTTPKLQKKIKNYNGVLGLRTLDYLKIRNDFSAIVFPGDIVYRLDHSNLPEKDKLEFLGKKLNTIKYPKLYKAIETEKEGQIADSFQEKISPVTEKIPVQVNLY
jgi:hypothetical protein